MDRNEKPPVAATTEGMSKTVVANDLDRIAYRRTAGNRIVTFRTSDGVAWTYRGKRARVLAMLAERPDGLTQHDTFPWHTRLGGTVHAMRKDGLTISTELEGKYRHARYRLTTPGSLLIHPQNREADQ